MKTYVIALTVFTSGYLINMFYITVLYHRALAHRSIILRPFLLRFLSTTGIWVTGLDPKGWIAMHRLHHLHSDTNQDPHSPGHLGIFGVWVGQYRAYKQILQDLETGKNKVLEQLISDIPFDVSIVHRKNLSNFPYLFHILLALVFAEAFDSVLIGSAYFLGIMSHPFQGWMVNALAHRFGHRNFHTNDNSRNNLLVAYLVFGEGLQNNHHAHPHRANFSFSTYELDLGYGMCWMAERFKLLKIVRE